MQTVATQQILASLAKKTGTNINIGKVRYRFNKSLSIKHFLIADLNNDTLIYINNIKLDIEKIDIGTKSLAISSATLLGIDGRVIQLDSSKFNFSSFIDSLKNDEKEEFLWNIKCKELNFSNSKITLNLLDKETFTIHNLHAIGNQLNFSPNEISFLLDQFKFRVNNAFDLKKLTFSFHKQDNLISIRGFKMLTNKSHININKTKIIIPNKSDAKPVFCSMNIHSSKLATKEFGIFTDKLNGVNENIQLTGKISGDINHLFGEKINILIGEESAINTDFIIKNINDPKKFKYDVTIHEILSNAKSVQKITNSILDTIDFKLPDELDKLGNVFFSGKLNGTSKKLRSSGSINCDIGLIETNFALTKTKDKTIINGDIQTMPIYLGNILTDSTIGSLNMDINLNGFISKSKGLELEINGGISDIEYHNITLDSIGINGKIENKSFYGRVSSFDPNLRLDFEGLVRLDSIPEYKFKTSVYSCDLHALGLTNINETSDLSFNLNANFIGNDYSNTNGTFIISDLFYFKDSSYFATDSILIKSKASDFENSIDFKSEYFNANIIGKFHPTQFFNGIKSLLNTYTPSIINLTEIKDTTSQFTFNIFADYPHPITELLAPELKISSGTKITGFFDANINRFNIKLSSDRLSFENREINNIKLFCSNTNDAIKLKLKSSELKYSDENSLKNFSFRSTIYNDSISNNINWNNWLLNNYSGNINSLISLKSIKSNDNANFKVDIFPSNLIMNDTLWSINKSTILYDTTGIVFNDIKIDNGNSVFSIDGKLSDNPNDSIDIYLKNIDLEHLNTLIKAESIKFGGIASGNSRLKDLKGEQKINFDLMVTDLTINNSLVGQTHLISNWSVEEKQLNVLGITTEKKDTTFTFNGYISPSRNEMNCNVTFDNYDLALLEAFITPTFRRVVGRGTGNVNVSGKFPSPNWEGSIYAENAILDVDVLKVAYSLSDSIHLTKNSIVFDSIAIFDKDNNMGIVDGEINHIAYKDFSYDIDIETDNILGIDTKYSDNPLFYGKAYGKGKVRISGKTEDLNIEIAATTQKNTQFTIPLEGKGEIQDNDFITFYDPFSLKTENKEVKDIVIVEQNNTSLNINLTVTPDAEILIIFDPQVGDMLKAKGNAELTMEAKGNDFFMFGDYNIYKGDFIFTLQNVINKHLEIQQGSSVSWSGDPINADINLDAVYKIRRVTLGDLTQIEADMDKKIPVNCHLLMTNKLLNPEIKFMVDVPSTTNNEAVEQINSLTEDEINKQVLSLLLVNKFTPLPGLIQNDNANTTTNLGATTASELLSNQLSSWLSQVTTEFDVGFSYRPGDEYSQQEYEVALSTTFWDDRIAINGNFGYNANQNGGENQDTPYTTDFQVEFKLNKKGNIRLNAFQKVNNDYIYNGTAPYTQGIGVFYTEEFNDFDELMMKMFRKETAKKPEEQEEQDPIKKETLP